MSGMVVSPALLVLLLVLTVARLTTLVTDDYLTFPLREWADRRAKHGSLDVNPRIWRYLAYLLNCPWCVSTWIGLPLGGATYAWHRHWPIQVLLLGLAASEVTGLFATVRDALEGPSS